MGFLRFSDILALMGAFPLPSSSLILEAVSEAKLQSVGGEGALTFYITTFWHISSLGGGEKFQLEGRLRRSASSFLAREKKNKK